MGKSKESIRFPWDAHVPEKPADHSEGVYWRKRAWKTYGLGVFLVYIVVGRRSGARARFRVVPASGKILRRLEGKRRLFSGGRRRQEDQYKWG